MTDDQKLIEIAHQPHILGHIAGKTLLTPEHSRWIKYIYLTSENRSLQAHRGSYKTTAIIVIGAIWYLLFNPDTRIAIIRKSFNDAADCLRNIRNIMQLPEIQYLFYIAHGKIPKPVVQQARSLVYSFKKTQTIEGNIDAYGIDSAITGKHYDKIKCDDIITVKDRVSQAERDRTDNAVRELQTNIIDPGKPICYIGTPWKKDDTWRLCPEPARFDVYQTGILSKAEIEDKQRKTTPSLFAANYELVHVSSEDTLFKEPQYDRWDYRLDRNVFAHLDAKYFGSDTNGFTIMARRKDGKIQAVGFMWVEDIRKKLHEVVRLYKKYFCKILYLETNADKGFLADEFTKLGISTSTYHESMNKTVKIGQYLTFAWDNIIWGHDTDPEYMAQILDYVEDQEPDDCCDSAASLVQKAFWTGAGSALNEW